MLDADNPTVSTTAHVTGMLHAALPTCRAAPPLAAR
jgi:hypothetical protein